MTPRVRKQFVSVAAPLRQPNLDHTEFVRDNKTQQPADQPTTELRKQDVLLPS